MNDSRDTIKRLESVSKMTKYQLVFVKVQSAISRLCQLAKNSELIKLQKAFDRLRDNAGNVKKVQAEHILEQIKDSIIRLVKAKERLNKALLAKFVCRWKNAIARQKLFKKIDIKLSSIEKKHKKEIIAKNCAVINLEQKLQQRNAEIGTLKEVEQNLRSRLRLKEELVQENTTNKNTKRSADKAFKTTEEQIQVLETRAEQLENENRDLKDRLESAETTVGDFIQEVSEILDSHEFMSK